MAKRTPKKRTSARGATGRPKAGRGRKAARTSTSDRRKGTSAPARRGASARPARPAGARPPPTGRWLVKTEPGTYGYADLEREGRTVWEGVANALARIHLRAMREGDLVLVYHTGAEKAVTGLARVVAGPRVPVPAPADDDKAVVVDLAAVARAAPAVPASDLRGEPSCRDLALFTIPRLSVMPVPLDAFAVIAKRGGLPAGL